MENIHEKPLILYEGNFSIDDIEEIKKNYRIWRTIDIYEDQIKELFEIENPQLKQSSNFKKYQLEFVNNRLSNNPSLKGNWIYFPWNGYLIHCVNDQDYFTLRTDRNKEIIKKNEQEVLINSCVGFLGMSIGQHMALSLVYNGIAKHMKIADFDLLSTTNLNRVRAGIKDVGTPKLSIAAQNIYEVNPYQKLTMFPEGINDETIPFFFDKDPKPNIIFEAIDNFEMKIKIRLEARKRKVPVIMLTNLANSILVDIERYDLNDQLPLFNGLIGNIPNEIISTRLTEIAKIKYARDLVGEKYLSTRILETLYGINKTRVGRPQINSTVTIAGGFASYLTQRLLLKKNLPSGRLYTSFDEIFGFSESENKEKRKKISDMLNEKLS